MSLYETDEDLLKAAGVKRSRVGRAAEGGFLGILATILIVAAIGTRVASFLGAVGMVLKFFGAPFMASWSWGLLLVMFVSSVVLWVGIEAFK